MAGLGRVVGADAQRRAGVAARPVGHHDHTRTLAVRDASQVLLGELEGQRAASGEELQGSFLEAGHRETTGNVCVSGDSFRRPRRSSSKHLQPGVTDLFKRCFTGPESDEGQPGCYTLSPEITFSQFAFR